MLEFLAYLALGLVAFGTCWATVTMVGRLK